MAFADPQSVTISGTATPLPRTGLTLNSGSFGSADAQVELQLSHVKKSRARHLAKLSKQSIVADPLIPDINRSVSYSAHIVVDLPLNGVTNAEAKSLAAALVAWATPANIEKMLGGES